MSRHEEEIVCNKLEFNIYCIFTQEKKDVKEVIGLIFKDYLESLKNKDK